MPIRDNSLVIRMASDGAILAAGTVISKEIFGTALRGMALAIHVPATTQGCTPLLAINIHASSTSAAATTNPIIAARDGIAEGVGDYIIPFSTKARSIAVAFIVSGGSTPGFSGVEAWLTEPFGQDWTRTTEFI